MSDLSLTRFEALFGPEFGHGKAMETERLRRALATLGAPHDKLPPAIHVAGTNGKGSTIAFLRAMAAQAGLSVHAFTKPHLMCLNERFVVAGEIIDDARLIAAAERVAGANTDLTQFEAQVAAAFLLFSETPADLCLIETGMGGRDDATNVIAKPAVCVLTPIGLDHQDALGPGLGDIARHKAGILKPGVVAAIARQSEEVRAVIEEEAARIGAPLLRQGVEWDCFSSNGRLVVQTETRALDLSPPALIGAHQVDNAGLAVAALLALNVARIDEAAMSRGLAGARWPGRLQPLTSGPLAAPVLAIGGELWIDGAHNAHAAAALARALAELHRRAPRPLAFIVGLRARKDAEAFVRTLAPGAALIVAVPLPRPSPLVGEGGSTRIVEADEGCERHVLGSKSLHPSSGLASLDHLLPQGEKDADPEALAQIARAAGVEAASAASLEAAIARALQLGAPRIVITGSLKLAGEVLARTAG